jgi:hypothetical protein
MKQIDSDLWVAESPLRFLGLEVGARMTVVRLPGPRLLIHSPIDLTDELVQEISALGPVASLVAPNRLHHLFINSWQKAFPEASTYVAPGLDTKRPDLQITRVLSDEPESEWSETIDQALVHGIPYVSEVVFFHRPSATLIATDLAFNIGRSSPPLTRLFFRLARTYGRLSPTLLERLLVRDRPAFRRSLECILEWPFERIVVAHGEVSEMGGRAELINSYGWALAGSDGK